MQNERDLDKNPYTPEEQRVCDYLQKITDNQVGCGDDPIGFLIASHASQGFMLRDLTAALRDCRERLKERG